MAGRSTPLVTTGGSSFERLSIFAHVLGWHQHEQEVPPAALFSHIHVRNLRSLPDNLAGQLAYEQAIDVKVLDCPVLGVYTDYGYIFWGSLRWAFD